MFRHMGHDDVVVLDGGLPKWQAENRVTEDMPPIARERLGVLRDTLQGEDGNDTILGGADTASRWAASSQPN